MKKDSPDTPAQPRSSIGGRIWKILMGALLILAGSIFVDYLWSSYQRAARMDPWLEVPCTILTLDVDDSELNQRGMPKYILEVTYRYEFDGKEWVGDRIKRLPTEASDPRKLEDKIESYAAGTETVCFVDPEDPSMAVLKRDTKASLYAIWFPCLFIVGGAGMIFSALFRKG